MASSPSSKSLGMYAVKPFNDVSLSAGELPKPSCMYPMKNYHENAIDNKLREPLESLLERQIAVLDDLEKLKKVVCELFPEKDVESVGNVKISSSAQVGPKLNQTVVVKSSPDNPPLSLVVLLKMLQNSGSTCSTVTHRHSSLTANIPNHLQNFLGGSRQTTDPDSDLCLRVIWKEKMLAPSLMMSVVDQSPILGEANILRYLCRAHLPHLYSKLGPMAMANIDSWLDAASSLSEPKNGKAFLESLNGHLGEHKWLGGSAPSLADVYCGIVVLKTQSKSNSQCSSYVEKWLNNCRTELSGFNDVESMIKNS